MTNISITVDATFLFGCHLQINPDLLARLGGGWLRTIPWSAPHSSWPCRYSNAWILPSQAQVLWTRYHEYEQPWLFSPKIKKTVRWWSRSCLWYGCGQDRWCVVGAKQFKKIKAVANTGEMCVLTTDYLYVFFWPGIFNLLTRQAKNCSLILFLLLDFIFARCSLLLLLDFIFARCSLLLLLDFIFAHCSLLLIHNCWNVSLNS
jgi:hypothetical protein